MASIIAWLVGLLLVGVGGWILFVRFEGLVDLIKPHNMSIGQVTVDGTESKGHAELLRARFDHHFRRPAAMPKETGFLEVVSLDAPELFQPKGLEGELRQVTVEVSGVDVSKFLHLVNQIAKPDQWVVEGDFQTQSDRALLALRLRRGQRLIRTWYLERLGAPSSDKSLLLEQLIDDAIFQLVYDFGNEAEQDSDIRKWRHVVPAPTRFPSRTAVAAFYEARGALGRYYAQGDWADLDRALDCLRTLRAQMPEYEDGLQLLGMALAEKRKETEAIHVYEHLLSLLLPEEEREKREKHWEGLSSEAKRRVLSVELLKATATAKLYSWRSAHQAIRELSDLYRKLQDEEAAAPPGGERAAYMELQAQSAVQLAQTYALYLAYLRHSQVAEVFGTSDAPEMLRIEDSETLSILRGGLPERAKNIVREQVRKVVQRHNDWLETAKKKQENLAALWGKLADGDRRKAELASRLHLASGCANYRMAEWEDHRAEHDSVFGETFDTRLEKAAEELRAADAAHPNHYLVLQFLGLVFSEPRRDDSSLSLAEQYFERAIRANPSDYYGHELLASVLLRRLANRGLDLESRAMIERGIEEAQSAIDEREISGAAHLLRAELQLMLLEVEKDEAKSLELRAGLERYLRQAERFLPQAFRRPDPDLTWLRIVAATRRLGEAPEASMSPRLKPDELEEEKLRLFEESKKQLQARIEELKSDCERLEERWVARQRVFLIGNLKARATALNDEIAKAPLASWREIPIAVR